MKLINVPNWRTKYFEDDSRPAEITVMRLLRDGKLPGRKVGGKWFVDEHAWLAGDDPLVQRVLEAG